MQRSSMFLFTIALLCLLEAILQRVLYPRFFLMSLEGFWWCDAIAGGGGRNLSQELLLSRGKIDSYTYKVLEWQPPWSARTFWTKTIILTCKWVLDFHQAIVTVHWKQSFHECSFKTKSYFFSTEKNWDFMLVLFLELFLAVPWGIYV